MNKYARCIRNETYFRGDGAENFVPDLLVGEVYRLLRVSPTEEKRRLMRVVDRSGVGYLYPRDYFEMLTEEELLASPAAITVYMSLRDKVELRTQADRQSEQLQKSVSMSHIVREWVEERLDLASK